MSQSKALASGKPKSKSKAAAPKRKSVTTVRVIEAPTAPEVPSFDLSAAEKARSEQAIALAAEIEKAIVGGKESFVLSPEAVQALLSAVSKVYSGQSENGARYDAYSQRHPLTPTDVMVTASGLLKAANLAVFELGMWQSWTGR